MASGDLGDPTVCVPGPVVVVHAAHPEIATDLSKTVHSLNDQKCNDQFVILTFILNCDVLALVQCIHTSLNILLYFKIFYIS